VRASRDKGADRERVHLRVPPDILEVRAALMACLLHTISGISRLCWLDNRQALMAILEGRDDKVCPRRSAKPVIRAQTACLDVSG